MSMTVTYAITLGWWIVAALAVSFAHVCMARSRLAGGWTTVYIQPIAVFICGVLASLVRAFLA